MREFITLNGMQRLGLVKRVQRGTITIPGVSASGAVTIHEIVPSNTLIYWGGFWVGGNDFPDHSWGHMSFTNTTTLTATRGATGGNSLSVDWEAVEFHPGVLRSVQRGIITGLTGANTAAITPVDITKAQCNLLGYLTTYTANDAGTPYLMPRVQLQDLATVRTNNGGGGWSSLSWQVGEFN